jgi:hypothetical protein
LNTWVIHDFVPTLYSLELPRDSMSRRRLLDIFNHKIELYKKTKIIIKDLYVENHDLNDLPRLNYEIPIDISLPGDNLNQFLKTLKILKRLKKLVLLNKSILFKKRASISMLVILGWQLGFKEIILCGVDLNNTKYFYESNLKYYNSKGFKLPNTGQEKKGVHKTLKKEYGLLTIDQVIYGINDVLLKPDGIVLYTAFNTSILSEKLPHYYD